MCRLDKTCHWIRLSVHGEQMAVNAVTPVIIQQHIMNPHLLRLMEHILEKTVLVA
jgi:hypothetical protein